MWVLAGKGPMRDTLTSPNEWECVHVNYRQGTGVWNVNLVQNNFPNLWADAITSIPLPISSILHDSPSWTRTGSGKFLISSCYRKIIDTNISNNTNNACKLEMDLETKTSTKNHYVFMAYYSLMKLVCT